MNENQIGEIIIKAAIKVHSALGPGLLESAYEACFAHECASQGLSVKRQVVQPIDYDGVHIDAGYRLDVLVNQLVAVELKVTDGIHPIHTAQLLTYLRLGGYRLGYILNFNVALMRDGIKRVVNGL